MSSVAITTAEDLLEINTLCPDCQSDIEYITSETNSEYYYCKICNYNNNNIKKHITFDKILKSMQHYFYKVKLNNMDELRISVEVSKKYMSLYINNESISGEQFLTNINNKDIKMFRDTINYFIEDSFEEASIRSSVNILI